MVTDLVKLFEYFKIDNIYRIKKGGLITIIVLFPCSLFSIGCFVVAASTGRLQKNQ
jgi:hypothetical protein